MRIHVCDICGGESDEPMNEYKFDGDHYPVKLCENCEDAEMEVHISQYIKGLAQ